MPPPACLVNLQLHVVWEALESGIASNEARAKLANGVNMAEHDDYEWDKRLGGSTYAHYQDMERQRKKQDERNDSERRRWAHLYEDQSNSPKQPTTTEAGFANIKSSGAPILIGLFIVTIPFVIAYLCARGNKPEDIFEAAVSSICCALIGYFLAPLTSELFFGRSDIPSDVFMFWAVVMTWFLFCALSLKDKFFPESS